jgi:hypothetical protein
MSAIAEIFKDIRYSIKDSKLTLALCVIASVLSLVSVWFLAGVIIGLSGYVINVINGGVICA